MSRHAKDRGTGVVIRWERNPAGPAHYSTARAVSPVRSAPETEREELGRQWGQDRKPVFLFLEISMCLFGPSVPRYGVEGLTPSAGKAFALA